MSNDELTTSDVLNDKQKNFHELYVRDDDDDHSVPLFDSLYYTETEFVDFIGTQNQTKTKNLTILSLNIANLLSKLNSFKLFLNNISTQQNSPEIIVVVETHVSETNTVYTQAELKNILPNYNFLVACTRLNKSLCRSVGWSVPLYLLVCPTLLFLYF